MGFNPDSSSTSGIRFNPGKGNAYRDDSSSTKPSGAPDSGKDFKKILAKGDQPPSKDELEEDVVLENQSVQNSRLQEKNKKPIASLFSLASSGASASEKGQDASLAKAALDAETPNDLYSKLAATTPPKTEDKLHYPPHPPKPASHAKHKPPVHHTPTQKPTDTSKNTIAEAEDARRLSQQKDEDFVSDKERFSTRYVEEHPDLSYINPMNMAGNNDVNLAMTAGADKALSASNLKEIIDQIVDKLYTVSVEGRTDTTIVLQHPPVFEGVSIIVSSYDSAKGQFNIAFENLTQQAKTLLESHQASLLNALDTRGYTVQILTITTLAETPIIAADPSQQGRDHDEGQQQGQRQRQEQEDSEHTT